MWQNEMFARHFWVGYKSGGTDVIIPLWKIRLESSWQKSQKDWDEGFETRLPHVEHGSWWPQGVADRKSDL